MEAGIKPRTANIGVIVLPAVIYEAKEEGERYGAAEKFTEPPCPFPRK